MGRDLCKCKSANHDQAASPWASPRGVTNADSRRSIARRVEMIGNRTRVLLCLLRIRDLCRAQVSRHAHTPSMVAATPKIQTHGGMVVPCKKMHCMCDEIACSVHEL